MSSAIGGYLAGRLRTKWTGLHANEVFFRDTAHGFLAWAFATLISATALASTTAYLANGTAAGVAGIRAGRALRQPVGNLCRQAVSNDAGSTTGRVHSQSSRRERQCRSRQCECRQRCRGWRFERNQRIPNARRSFAFVDRQLPQQRRSHADDRTYVAQVVAARTGMSQADAEKRVDQVVAEAKTAADNARRGAAHLSFWLTAALLFGAFAASLAAAEGGMLRDGTWNDRVLTPRVI